MLARMPGAAAGRALLAAVVPGGVVLFVHPADMQDRHGHGHGRTVDDGFDAADFVWPATLVAALGAEWDLEVAERRPRLAPDRGAGALHTDDLELRSPRLR
jgi:hypothetical protein